MTKKKGSFEPHGFTVDYTLLGTISIDELKHAILEDIEILKDVHNIRYVTGPRLKLFATDEYGEQVRVRRPGGGYFYYMRTHHYRPACKDYEL